jgi:ABC-type phosphate transport system substrate-binding protein
MPGFEHGTRTNRVLSTRLRFALNPEPEPFWRKNHVTLTSRTRLGAIALAAAFAVGACSNTGSTTSPATGGESAPAGGSPGAGASAGAGGGAPECLSFADLYALIGPESENVTTWDAAATIAGELGSNTEFPAGVPVSITAPGEESGTFDSFVEIVLSDYIEERGQPEEATTRLSNYQSSANDNAIIDGIANSAGSLGWVGFAFYEENVDRVRAFAISEEPNGECVEPSAETIADNSYPIARDLFIYVSKPRLESNPAVAAYVDYYLADGTIDTVLETVPYVPLGDALAESRTAWETFKGSTAGDPNGTITVTGSSTVEPISNAVAEAFKAENAGFNYTVEGPGTGDGFAKFCAGEADITDASRQISEEEVAECEAGGVEYVEIKVAIDGIAVLTQK